MSRKPFMIKELEGDAFVARLLNYKGDIEFEVHARYTGRGRMVPGGTFHAFGDQKEWELDNIVVNGTRQHKDDNDVYTVVEGHQPVFRIYTDGETEIPDKEYVVDEIIERSKLADVRYGKRRGTRRKTTKRKTKRKRKRTKRKRTPKPSRLRMMF